MNLHDKIAWLIIIVFFIVFLFYKYFYKIKPVLPTLSNDSLLMNDISQILYRYSKKLYLNTYNILNFFGETLYYINEECTLPFISIRIDAGNQKDKKILEIQYSAMIKKKIPTMGIFIQWGKDTNVTGLDILQIFFARNAEELNIMNSSKRLITSQIVSKTKLPIPKIKKNTFVLGIDYKAWADTKAKIPIEAPIGHLIVVGGTGTGKSMALLFFLTNIRKRNFPIRLYACDFKASGDFRGISQDYAEFEACYELIKEFYKDFKNTPENNTEIKILLIDEIAAMLTHYEMNKETKPIAEEVRKIISSVLMLGRSKNCFLWLGLQRYTATLFPSSSGAGDNFNISIGLGKLHTDARRGLFGGETFEGEDLLTFVQGSGIVLIDGTSLQSLILPRLDKQKMIHYLMQS